VLVLRLLVFSDSVSHTQSRIRHGSTNENFRKLKSIAIQQKNARECALMYNTITRVSKHPQI